MKEDFHGRPVKHGCIFALSDEGSGQSESSGCFQRLETGYVDALGGLSLLGNAIHLYADLAGYAGATLCARFSLREFRHRAAVGNGAIGGGERDLIPLPIADGLPIPLPCSLASHRREGGVSG